MSDRTGLKILRYFTQKLKAFFFSKDILSFLLFLILSAVFWFVHALGKERETTVTVPIVYSGIPLNAEFKKSLPSQVRLTIKDQGVNLLDYSQHIRPLAIDLSSFFHNKEDVRISAEQLKLKVHHTLNLLPSTAVLDIRPDSVASQYTLLESKVLPVKLVADIEPAPQYMLSGTIHLSPGKLEVFGPQHMLDTMTCVYTEPLILKNISDTVQTALPLRLGRRMRCAQKKVHVNVYAEAFTEKKMQFPVMTVNCPAGYAVKTFPAYVQVTYTVGLSHFNKPNTNEIQVYLDYNDLIDNHQGRQMLRVKNNSRNINNIRISPQEVEFILEHN